MIFVVMRPKTRERMAQRRGSRLCDRTDECGELSQMASEPVKMTMGVHSIKVGRKGRF